MASLPAKPQDSPSREVTDVRFPIDERSRRPSRSTHPPHRGPFRNETPDDRSRRRPPVTDSYYPSSYDRQEEEYFRRDVDPRPRGHWDRQRNSEPRFGRGPDYSDRDRRFEKSRHYDPYPPRHRDSYEHGRRVRSRSPSRWTPSNRRPLSRSPSPRKQMKLGNHSIATSSRRPSPQRARYSRSRSRGPSRRPRSRSPPRIAPSNITPEEGAISDIVMVPSEMQSAAEVLEPSHQVKMEATAPSRPIAPQDEIFQDVVVDTDMSAQIDNPSVTRSPTPHKHVEHPAPANVDDVPLSVILPSPSPLHEPPLEEKAEEQKEPQSEVKLVVAETNLQEQPSKPPIQTCVKSPSPPRQPRLKLPSPPKQPRFRGTVLPPPPIYQRRTSRSPPRGPRNYPGTHPRGHLPPTGPASSHPPGPWGQRRPFQPAGSVAGRSPRPSTPQTQSPVVPSLPGPSEGTLSSTAPPPDVIKIPLPIIPMVKLPPSLTKDLDAEMSRLQTYRTRLAQEYTTLAKEARRALHELDTANMDLRAAELRRRVADTQNEKARNGALGIDYVPDSSMPL